MVASLPDTSVTHASSRYKVRFGDGDRCFEAGVVFQSNGLSIRSKLMARSLRIESPNLLFNPLILERL